MNPRVKKIGRNILFLLSIPGIVGAFIFANSNKQEEKLHGIHVDIENTDLSFVTNEDILQLISANHVHVGESIINEIKINSLENKIRENKWVKDAEMYITANHDMNIKISQRIPKIRINQTDSNDYAYYLDAQANPIELSDQYIAKVPVVTAPELGYTMTDLHIKNDLVKLATYIEADPFWNTMISQINVNDRQQIELIPALGNHLIQLGTADDLDSKMKRLLAFYQTGLTTIDWNRYDEIDLRFAHQVVARNTHVKELVNKTIEKAKEEMIKEQREKYLLALQAGPKKKTTPLKNKPVEPKAKTTNHKPSTH
jgi:cell division protein FtsQ